MAFAQLTYRESLRDLATCLLAQSAKLYHLGLHGTVACSTLADANEARDWRIYAEFAQHLIRIARRLYLEEPFGVDLKETVYALDSTTIDLCLSVFPWAPFSSTKAAIKLHTLIDLRGNIPTFIHISDGKLHDVNVLDDLLPEPGAFYVMDRGYLDFELLHRWHLAGAFFVTRAKSNLKAKRRYPYPVDRSLPHSLQDRRRQDTGVPDQQLHAAGVHHHRALSLSLAGRTLLLNGSSSICVSRLSSVLPRTRSSRKCGSPSASTCWSPSCANACSSTHRCMRRYR